MEFVGVCGPQAAHTHKLQKQKPRRRRRLVQSNKGGLISNNFLWMQYNKHALGIIIYHLDPLINFVCGYIFLDNGASEFTNILLNNLSSSICRYILVSSKIINNQ